MSEMPSTEMTMQMIVRADIVRSTSEVLVLLVEAIEEDEEVNGTRG